MEIYKQIDSGSDSFKKTLIPLSLTTLSGDNLRFTKLDRTDISNTFLGNLFSSFNLPITIEQKQNFTTGSYANTAFQYLNQDEVIMVEIPKNTYGELVDGKTIKLIIPMRSGATYTLYSTFFRNSIIDTAGNSIYSDPNQQSKEFGQNYNIEELPGQNGLTNPINGYSSNVAYMFSDDIQKPSNNPNYSWGSTNKYFATQTNLPTGIVGSKFAANFSSSDGTVDIPVGIAYLDMGFILITNPTIVQNFDYNTGEINGSPYTGDGSDFINLTFPTRSQLTFTSCTTEFVQRAICIALPNEFYKSTNPTFQEAYGADNLENNPVAITQIGLYNENYELIAIAKSNQPLAKNKSSILTFDITIRV